MLCEFWIHTSLEQKSNSLKDFEFTLFIFQIECGFNQNIVRVMILIRSSILISAPELIAGWF